MAGWWCREGVKRRLQGSKLYWAEVCIWSLEGQNIYMYCGTQIRIRKQYWINVQSTCPSCWPRCEPMANKEDKEGQWRIVKDYGQGQIQQHNVVTQLPLWVFYMYFIFFPLFLAVVVFLGKLFFLFIFFFQRGAHKKQPQKFSAQSDTRRGP